MDTIPLKDVPVHKRRSRGLEDREAERESGDANEKVGLSHTIPPSFPCCPTRKLSAYSNMYFCYKV
jgi:hypothetical protein